MLGENTDNGYKQEATKQSTGHWKIRWRRRTSACHCPHSATLHWCSWVRQWWSRKWGIDTVQEENKIVFFQVCDCHSPKSSFENDQNHYSCSVRCLDRGSLYLYTCISTSLRQRDETWREQKTGQGPGVPKNDMMTVLGCPFASYIPDLEVKNLTTWKCHSTGVSCRFLLQGIFLTQESNLRLLGLLHWQADFFTTGPPGKPTDKNTSKQAAP